MNTSTQTIENSPSTKVGARRTQARPEPISEGEMAEAQRATRGMPSTEQQFMVELRSGLDAILALGQIATEKFDTAGVTADQVATAMRSLGFKRVTLTDEDLADPVTCNDKLGERGYAIIHRLGKPPAFIADPSTMYALISVLKADNDVIRRAIALKTPELILAADLELTKATFDVMRTAGMYQAPPRIARGLQELEWWEYALIATAIAVGTGAVALGVGYLLWGDKQVDQGIPQL